MNQRNRRMWRSFWRGVESVFDPLGTPPRRRLRKQNDEEALESDWRKVLDPPHTL